MSIKNFCNQNVVTCKGGDSLLKAVGLLKDKRVGCLIVVEESKGKSFPYGIITDRDIALAVGTYKNPQAVQVDKVMKTNLITSDISDGVADVMFKMNQFGVKRVPIVDDESVLCGIVSSDDLLKLLSQELFNLTSVAPVKSLQEKQKNFKPAKNDSLI